MEKSVVKNEFECQQKCIGNESRCKSCNVYVEENDVICELNKKTRLMKAADFKERRGSTYYGLVQVSSVVCVNSFKLRFLGSYLNSLIGDLNNSRYTKSIFHSLTTGNIYFCLFVCLNFFNKVRKAKYDFFVFIAYIVIDIYFERGNELTNSFCS